MGHNLRVKSHGVVDTIDKLRRKAREKLASQLLLLLSFAISSKIIWL